MIKIIIEFIPIYVIYYDFVGFYNLLKAVCLVNNIYNIYIYIKCISK